MRTVLCAILLVAALSAAAVSGGCVQVDVPDGPYVSGATGGGADRGRAGEIKEFLQEAREDGLVTDEQYRRLISRLED